VGEQSEQTGAGERFAKYSDGTAPLRSRLRTVSRQDRCRCIMRKGNSTLRRPPSQR
jgi:hypothetical protein